MENFFAWYDTNTQDLCKWTKHYEGQTFLRHYNDDERAHFIRSDQNNIFCEKINYDMRWDMNGDNIWPGLGYGNKVFINGSRRYW